MNMTKQDLKIAMAAALWMFNNSPDQSASQAAKAKTVTSVFFPGLNKTLTNVVFFDDEKTSVNGMTGILDDTFLITFDASVDAQDWLTDLFFFKKVMPYKGHEDSPVRMHGGYAAGWLTVRDGVHAAFRASKLTKIFVCGYSMGGGLAPIGALDMQYTFNLGPDQIKCLSGDGPRVMNKAGMKSYNKRVPNTIRSKIGNDIVTKVPPSLWGFRHVAKQYHVGAKEYWWKMSVKDHMSYNDFIASINALPDGPIDEKILREHR